MSSQNIEKCYTYWRFLHKNYYKNSIRNLYDIIHREIVKYNFIFEFMCRIFPEITFISAVYISNIDI